jgi:uncharacterized protein (TIGR03437 family)
VVPIGGPASDIVLDESRGVLYIANFGANTIQVMSLSDNTIHTSMNVAPQPGSMALSPDNQYLVIVHYGNFGAGLSTSNLVTVIHLADNTRQTFSTGDPPLGVAFIATGQAMIVTTTGFVMFDPVSGQMAVLGTFANLSKALPVVQNTFPGQILETAMTTSADGQVIWGIGGGGTGTQIIYTYYAKTNSLSLTLDVSSPALLPRVSVSAHGDYAMVGWSLLQGYYIKGRYPNVISSPNITGHAIDSTNGIIYGQFPDASQPSGPPAASSSPAAAAPSANLPALLIMAADNMTVLDRITIAENMVGRAVLSSDNNMLYAVSESGVMVMPVGQINKYPRVQAASEDVLVQTNFCNRNAVNQSLVIADPGGNHTDFSISASQPGVSIIPSSGVTPATVQIRVNPTQFANTNGTSVIALTISSGSAINQPRQVRLLVNNPDTDQRGTLVDIPGTLTDVLADPVRNHYYVLRSDKNQLLVFDASSNNLLATLRTATTPSMMSMTLDQKMLMVGHNDSQLVTVYDLDALQPLPPVVLPGGHYARSIAASNAQTLVLARDEGTGTGAVDTISVASGRGTELPTLGVFKNSVNPSSVLVASPNGANILLASPDGNVMMYSAQSDTFTTSRQDFKALSGSFAASSFGTFVVGNNIFNSSLVPQGTLNTSGGQASGFAFVNQGGYFTTAANANGPGIIQNLPGLVSNAVKPVRMSEAPLLPTAAQTSSSSTGSTGGAGSAAGAITGTNGSGTTSLYSLTNFTRTLAPMPSAGTVVVLTTSGVTVLAANYDAAVAPPQIASVVSAASGQQVAPGGLISVYGAQMSALNIATSQIPLPTALGDSCLSINGAPVPLLFVSNQQINAQLPFNVAGNATMTVHTPGGISNNFLFTVQQAAPSIFQTGSAGPLTGLATIVRSDDGQLITPTNPIHSKDTVVIYLTGMGVTQPVVDAGLPSPSNPLASVAIPPVVTLGGQNLSVLFAGLVPNEFGVYQINAQVPAAVIEGLSIPLSINQGGAITTLNVRVVK